MWAVFVAGSPATLVSQWAVEWPGATRDGGSFIRSGAAAVASRRRALQLAAIRVMKTPGFEHPFYWAGFMLGGDGR